MAILQVLKGPNPGTRYTLDSDRAILGRHPECDIILEVGAVSRQHAQILREGKDFFVEDLKSRNGTFVNGAVISGKHLLQDNDRVKICDILLTFHLAAPAPAEPEGDPYATSLLDEKETHSTILSKVSVSADSSMRISVQPELKLKALLEITRAVASATSIDTVAPKLLDGLFTIFIQADRGFIILKNGDGPLILKAQKTRRGDQDEERVQISRTIINKVMNDREAVLSADAASDERFDSSQSLADFRIRSMVCAPLLGSSGKVLGVIQLDSLDSRSHFQRDDLEVLASVASQAALALENAELHESELKQQGLHRDLDHARRIQGGFLPESPPKVPNYEFFSFYLAANQVGGDFFDYIPLPDGRIAVIVADVSGKGMPAALLMMKVAADARYLLAMEPSPAAAIAKLNVAFSRPGWEDRFVTLMLCVVDPVNNEITVVNAGHMAPYLRKASGEVVELGNGLTGVPLGVTDDYEFEATVHPIAAGEIVTVFTDGISEAMDIQNEIYGLERLQSQLQKQPYTTMNEFGEAVLKDVRTFVGDRSQSDDMCILCIGRKA